MLFAAGLELHLGVQNILQNILWVSKIFNNFPVLRMARKGQQKYTAIYVIP